ncbi:hypothetical protein FOCC_FOCC002561 [Frankliniella occidentalis]|nr:hypothetical protein FOCC_FOCC002561 [Frankliniella occidentalis]
MFTGLIAVLYSVLQPNDQRAGGPAEQGPVAAVQHEAAPAPGRQHTAPPHPLLPHLARLRLTRHGRRADRLPELPVRVHQDAGQELPQPGRRQPPGQQAQGPGRRRPQEVRLAGVAGAGSIATARRQQQHRDQVVAGARAAQHCAALQLGTTNKGRTKLPKRAERLPAAVAWRVFDSRPRPQLQLASSSPRLTFL